MLGTWNISNWQWSYSLKFNPEASFPLKKHILCIHMTGFQTKNLYLQICSLYRGSVCTTTKEKSHILFLLPKLVDFSVGNPAGMTNIQTMFDTSLCVLKEVADYRSDGVPYIDFQILKVSVFDRVYEKRYHGNYTIPGGWIALGHQPEKRWIPFNGDMWIVSSTRSKTTISRFECPIKGRCGYSNAQRTSKHVDMCLRVLYRLDTSRATRVAHIENY